uniref:Uncharacterized protein n=1 Tax=Glossina palpalis gambiensis TaxID=67801 RepID=A0A1B0BC59_9MUSC
MYMIPEKEICKEGKQQLSHLCLRNKYHLDMLNIWDSIPGLGPLTILIAWLLLDDNFKALILCTNFLLMASVRKCEKP